MKPRIATLQLYIDRLTLDGMSAADGRRIVEVLEKKLTALVNTGAEPLAVRNAAFPRLDGGTVASGSSADDIGRHLAVQIFRGLGGARHG